MADRGPSAFERAYETAYRQMCTPERKLLFKMKLTSRLKRRRFVTDHLNTLLDASMVCTVPVVSFVPGWLLEDVEWVVLKTGISMSIVGEAGDWIGFIVAPPEKKTPHA